MFEMVKVEEAPELQPADPTGPGAHDYNLFGFAVGTGDIDFTGTLEVVGGAPASFVFQPLWPDGACLIYWDPFSSYCIPPVPTAATELPDPYQDANSGFGSTVAVADFDSDNYADVAVGAPTADILGVLEAGKVVVFFGPDLLLVRQFTELDAGLPLTQSTRFGASLATGDIDDDGNPDLLVGTPGGGGGTRPGVVHIIDVSTYGYIGAANSLNPTTNGQFGVSLASADIDTFPEDDFVVGANGENAPNGRAYIFRNSLVATETLDPPGTPANINFGTTVAIGDADGDGDGDVAVSSLVTSAPARWLVAVHDVVGPSPVRWAILQDPVPSSSSGLNVSLAMADIDALGKADIIVGALDARPCASVDAGEVFAFLDLDSSGIPGQIRYFIDSQSMAPPAPNALVGYSVFAGEADTTCNGLEVIVGAPEADAGPTQPLQGKVIVLVQEP